jgi:hypothetical protein
MLSDKVPEHFMQRKSREKSRHVVQPRAPVGMHSQITTQSTTAPDVPPVPYLPEWCSADGEQDLMGLDFMFANTAGVFDNFGTSINTADMSWLESFPPSL